MTQTKLAWELLAKAQGSYRGNGLNHEKENYRGDLALRLSEEIRIFELSASATGDLGEVYHAEKSWIGFDLAGALVLYVASTNHPTVTPHTLNRIEEKADCRDVIFRFGEPDDRSSFREEIIFSLYSDGDFAHQYAWGLPGGNFAPRSSARMKPLK